MKSILCIQKRSEKLAKSIQILLEKVVSIRKYLLDTSNANSVQFLPKAKGVFLYKWTISTDLRKWKHQKHSHSSGTSLRTKNWEDRERCLEGKE